MNASDAYCQNTDMRINKNWHQAWLMPIKVNEKTLIAGGAGFLQHRYLSSPKRATIL